MTEEQKIAELLKPRIKVTALYPGSKFEVGEILIPNREDGVVNNEWVSADPDNRNYINVDVSKYPHLFSLLSWWQERGIEVMPEYVKDGHFILKVKYMIWVDTMLYQSTLGNTWHRVNESYYTISPATSSEYLKAKQKV